MSNYKKFGQENIRLINFNIDDLDNFESMQYQNFIKSMDKPSALQILINNVEGDYSQLSEKLAEIAEEQYPSDEEYAKGGSINKHWDKEYRDGGSISSDRRFTEWDFNKLMASDKFRAVWSGNLWEIIEEGRTSVLGKFNPKTKSLYISGDKNMNNFLVVWMTENGFVNSDEYAILANGGGVGKSKSFLHLYKLTYPNGQYRVEAYDGEAMTPKEALEKMRITLRGYKSYKYSGASSDSENYKKWYDKKDIGYSDTEAWDEVFGSKKYAKGGGVGKLIRNDIRKGEIFNYKGKPYKLYDFLIDFDGYTFDNIKGKELNGNTIITIKGDEINKIKLEKSTIDKLKKRKNFIKDNIKTLSKINNINIKDLFLEFNITDDKQFSGTLKRDDLIGSKVEYLSDVFVFTDALKILKSLKVLNIFPLKTKISQDYVTSGGNDDDDYESERNIHKHTIIQIKIYDKLSDKKIAEIGLGGFYIETDNYDITEKLIALENYFSNKYANGGGVERIDLFEDYENIPSNIQEILDEYSQDFEDGNYDGLAKALEEVESKGYTFEYYLDGQAYGLRPIGVPLNELKGYEDMGEEYAGGGAVGRNLADKIIKKLENKGYSNGDNLKLTEKFNGKDINLNFYFVGVAGIDEIENPILQIEIISKYLDFDRVDGLYETDDVLDWKLYKGKNLVCSMGGYWDEYQQPTVIKIGDIESSVFNFFPDEGNTDISLDTDQFEKNLKNALNEIKQKNLYSAVVSLEGYEQYSEKVDGLENAKQAIQDIKENTRFQVVKGDVASGDLIKQDEVIENYANGGGIKEKELWFSPYGEVKAEKRGTAKNYIEKHLAKSFGAEYMELVGEDEKDYIYELNGNPMMIAAKTAILQEETDLDIETYGRKKRVHIPKKSIDETSVHLRYPLITPFKNGGGVRGVKFNGLEFELLDIWKFEKTWDVKDKEFIDSWVGGKVPEEPKTLFELDDNDENALVNFVKSKGINVKYKTKSWDKHLLSPFIENLSQLSGIFDGDLKGGLWYYYIWKDVHDDEEGDDSRCQIRYLKLIGVRNSGNLHFEDYGFEFRYEKGCEIIGKVCDFVNDINGYSDFPQYLNKKGISEDMYANGGGIEDGSYERSLVLKAITGDEDFDTEFINLNSKHSYLIKSKYIGNRNEDFIYIKRKYIDDLSVEFKIKVEFDSDEDGVRALENEIIEVEGVEIDIKSFTKDEQKKINDFISELKYHLYGDDLDETEKSLRYAGGGGVSNSDWNPDYCKCIKDIRFKDSLNFFEGFEYTYDEHQNSIRVYYMDGRGVTMSKETFDKHFEKIGKDKDKLTYANGGAIKTDFNELGNTELRNVLISFWNDFFNNHIGNYLSIEKENYILSNIDNVFVIVRDEDKGNFSNVEKQNIDSFLSPYFDSDKKSLFTDFFNNYEIKDNKIIIYIKEEKMYANGGGVNKVGEYKVEEDIIRISKETGTSVKDVIVLLNAMIDAKLKDKDLIPRVYVTEDMKQKAQEIWETIKPKYKGDLGGFQYPSTIKYLVSHNYNFKNLLERIKRLGSVKMNDEIDEKYKTLKKYLLDNKSWFKDETNYSNENNHTIVLTTRENGDIYNGTPSKKDFLEAKKILDIVKSKFDILGDIDYADETVILTITLKNKYANGGGVDYDTRWAEMEAYSPYTSRAEYENKKDYEDLAFASKTFSKTSEILVRENLNNGEICMCKLTKIIGHEPNYPIQIVGSLKLEKCFLKRFYRIV